MLNPGGGGKGGVSQVFDTMIMVMKDSRYLKFMGFKSLKVFARITKKPHIPRPQVLTIMIARVYDHLPIHMTVLSNQRFKLNR